MYSMGKELGEMDPIKFHLKDITLQMRKRRRSKILPESFMQILFWVELQKQSFCSLELKFQPEEHQWHSVVDGDKW